MVKAAIVEKDELVEICIDMLAAQAVIRAQSPPLHQHKVPGESRATLRVRPFCRPRADHADNRSSPDRMNGHGSTSVDGLYVAGTKLRARRGIVRYHGEADATGTRIEIFRVLASAASG